MSISGSKKKIYKALDKYNSGNVLELHIYLYFEIGIPQIKEMKS